MSFSILSRFSCAAILTTLFTASTSHVSAQIKAEPEQPVVNQPAKLSIANPRQMDSAVDWEIQSLDPARLQEESHKASGTTSELTHTFERTGPYLISATITTPENSPKVIKLLTQVLDEPKTPSEEKELAGATPLGLTYLTWKQIQENELKLAIDTQAGGVRSSYNIVADVFNSLADEAPKVGLSEKQSDREKVQTFIDKTFETAKSSLKSKKRWGQDLGGLEAELGADPGEEAWTKFLNQLKLELERELYIKSGKPAGYAELFSWKDAWLEIGTGFSNAEESFTQFIRDYEAQNRATYNNYMQKYNRDHFQRDRYRGPKCPIFIRLGLF